MATCAISPPLTDDNHNLLRPTNNMNNKYMEEALARGLSAEDFQRARDQVTRMLGRQNGSSPSSSPSGSAPNLPNGSLNSNGASQSTQEGKPATELENSIKSNRPITFEESSVSAKPPTVVPSRGPLGDISFESSDTQNTALELLGLGVMGDQPLSSNTTMEVDSREANSTGPERAENDSDYPASNIDPDLIDDASIRRSGRSRIPSQNASQDFVYSYTGSGEEPERAESQSPKPEFAESSLASQSTATTQESQLSLSPSKRKKGEASDSPAKPKGPAPNLVKKDRSGKPPYSYAALIGQSINSKPDKRISLADIYNYICGNFSYYKKEDSGWQNSIRHNLSLNECFIKVPRAEGDAPGKGSFWCIAPGKEEQFVGGSFIKKGHLGKGPKTAKSKGSTSALPKEEGQQDQDEEGDELEGGDPDSMPATPLLGEDAGDDYDESLARPTKKVKRNPTTPKSPSKAKAKPKAKAKVPRLKTPPDSPTLNSSPSARPGLRSNTVIKEDTPDELDEDDESDIEDDLVDSRRSTRGDFEVDAGPLYALATGDRLRTPAKGQGHRHHRSLSRQLRYQSSSPELEFGSSTYGSADRRHGRSMSHASLNFGARDHSSAFALNSGTFPFLPPVNITSASLRSPDPSAASIFAVPSSPVIGSGGAFVNTHFQSPVSSMRSRFEETSMQPEEANESEESSSIGSEIPFHGRNASINSTANGSHTRQTSEIEAGDVSASTIAASQFLQMMQLGFNEEAAAKATPNMYGSPTRPVSMDEHIDRMQAD